MPDYWSVRLKHFREIAGLTQTELSEKSGVSQSLITNLENGKRNFTQKSLSDILKVLGKDYHDLFTNDKEDKDHVITTPLSIIDQVVTPQLNIHAVTSLMGIAGYVTEHGTGSQYERFRSFGEMIKQEIETVKKETSLQSTNAPDSSNQVPQNGLKVVNGGK